MSEKKYEREQTALEEHDNKKHELEESEVAEIYQQEVKKVVAEVIQGEFSGPIPPPSIIEGYERVLPGSADRIITMAEKQSEHRQRMEEKMIDSEARDGLLGVVFAFLLGIEYIIAAIIMVVLVPENAGAIAELY